MSGSHEPDLSAGTCIAGRYRIERQLGVGGMGAVYTALDLARNERVAVKVLGIDPSSDFARLERFRREARAVTQLGHPNIVRALDAGMIDPYTGDRLAGTMSGGGRGFLVMELLEGEDLHARLRREGRLAPAAGVAIARQVAAGLVAAHAQGIVHRDLKPENVFLCRDGVVKVLDFGLAQIDGGGGLARVTAQNALLGTPEYMSPEQAAGKLVDARADVYALGCILYEMFTGRPPFTGKSFVAVLMAQLAEAPVPPRACDPPARIPAPLEELILRSLAKEADARQPTMRVLATELADVDLAAAPAASAGAAPAAGPLVLAEADGDEGPTRVFGRHDALAALPVAPPRTGGAPAAGARPVAAPPMPRGGSGSYPATADVPPRRITGSRAPVTDVPPRRITGSRAPVTDVPPRRITGSRAAKSPPSDLSPELALMVSAVDDSRTVPMPKLSRGQLATQLAAQPDPLPRILDEIDPPQGAQLDAAKLIVLVLLGGATAAIVLWLLLR